MNDAECYHKANALQKRDASQVLQEYAKKIKFNHLGDRIIDVGCGDGSVMMEVLKKHVPENFQKLVGCDISDKMIYYASEHYGDERTSFRVVDIEGILPQDLVGEFDQVFSFYVLHWIKDQRTAFMNIYDLLDENGSCFLVFLGHMPIFDVYRKLAKLNRWCDRLQDVDKYVSPYHDVQDPEKDVRLIMEKAGFNDIEVRCLNKCYTYNNIEEMKQSVKAVNPFNIPVEEFDDFIEDYVTVLQDMRLMDKRNNNLTETVRIWANYTLIVVRGRK